MVRNTESKITGQNHPYYWLQQYIYEKHNSNTTFFQKITLTGDTIPQIEVFSQFLLNYQIVWVQQEQSAYSNFPQTLDATDFLFFLS